MADAPAPITLATLRPWVLGLWAALGSIGTLLLIRWVLHAPLEATDWFGQGATLFSGTAFVLLATGLSAVPLGELALRAGRPPSRRALGSLALPAVCLWLAWAGLLADRTIALADADARFADVLAAAPTPAAGASGCPPLEGRGVVLACGGRAVHPAHAGLPWARRASGAADTEWIAVVCPVTRPAASYRAQHVIPDPSVVTRSVEGAQVRLRDRAGRALGELELLPIVPERVRSDVLALSGDLRVAPWTVGAAIGACVDGRPPPAPH